MEGKMKKNKINGNMKLLIFSILGVFSLFIISCEKDEILKVQQPTSSCDTVNITYKTTIEPIIIEKCQGCHNNTTQRGGINLEGYENIKASAISGELINSIEGSMSGYFYTFKDTNSSCEFLQLKAWINKGAPND